FKLPIQLFYGVPYPELAFINPIWTYGNHYYTDLNNGNDVVERTNQSGYVTVRFSDIRNDDFCIVDTLTPIAPLSLSSQE
ncbi:hypothetical protein, partial [Bacteroides acidifaciens]|uniref:hypothetical protein n=1 Tax=Bacteroides acidifaciens TaxID=85831 RepID=UPI0030141FF2